MRLGQSTYDELVAHAREGSPHEVCGVLEGSEENGTVRVDALHPVENVADRRTVEYELDPRTQLTVMEAIEDRGREVVGFYHSHPAGPSHPSGTDRERATWLDHRYVIVSLRGDPHVGCWRWTGERFEQEPVEVV